MMTLPFEVQHRVYDVLERLGPGEIAVLRHMPDEKGGNVLPFGREEKLRCGFAYLPDAAGGRLKLQREHGLNRIHDDERGLQARNLFQDPFEARLREDVERCTFHTEPFATRL